MAWIWAELQFAGLFSYRIPNLSPGFALTSLIPSPSALRLALVERAIKSKSSVKYGEEIFELVKPCLLEIEPPEKVSVLKFFIKRLKPSKQKKGEPYKPCEESFGVREYCHFLGPIKIYLEISEEKEKIAQLFHKLRRLGTTDSILNCRVTITEKKPELKLTSREIKTLKPEVSNFIRRPVVTLNELKANAKFNQVNPYSQGRRDTPFFSKTFLLPLSETRRGENFILYQKTPFDL